MNGSDLGIMVISIIGVFGFASFIFEYLSSHHKKRKAHTHQPLSTKKGPGK